MNNYNNKMLSQQPILKSTTWVSVRRQIKSIINILLTLHLINSIRLPNFTLHASSNAEVANFSTPDFATGKVQICKYVLPKIKSIKVMRNICCRSLVSWRCWDENPTIAIEQSIVSTFRPYLLFHFKPP